VLSQQYGIEFWLERAYLDVCIADDWMSDGDGLRLGVAAVLKIGRARHELRMPAALKPETSRLGIVRATFGLADAIGSPSSISASSSGSKVDGADGTADIAAVSTPPLASNPDVESALVSAGAGVGLLPVSDHFIVQAGGLNFRPRSRDFPTRSCPRICDVGYDLWLSLRGRPSRCVYGRYRSA
jgi:hypothetical protein